MRWKTIPILGLICFCSISISACTAIGHAIQETTRNTLTQNYPPAIPKNKKLAESSPTVDLANYQSPHSRVGRPYQRPDITIAIAASGGGYRAANLDVGVLMGLENITDPHLPGNVLEQVSYFSTVSGGSIGIGYYMDQLYNFWFRHRHDKIMPHFSLQTIVDDMIEQQINRQQSSNVLTQDLTHHLFFGSRRALTFENHLDQHLLQTPHGSLTLGDIFIPHNHSSAEVHFPLWVTNSTIYQNVATFPFTPDVLTRYQIIKFNHQLKSFSLPDKKYSPSLYSQVPVAIGVAASASFPFATPATTLQSTACVGPCYLQLVDGGLADNLGIKTALNLLKQDKNKIKILIIIDAYNDEQGPFTRLPQPPGKLTLLSRLVTAGVDAWHQDIKDNISLISKNLLCQSGAHNVLVAHLSLDRYKAAKRIPTSLYLSRSEQQLLMSIGEELVDGDTEFHQQLHELLSGNVAIGACPSVK